MFDRFFRSACPGQLATIQLLPRAAEEVSSNIGD